jgi:hypothetical protein
MRPTPDRPASPPRYFIWTDGRGVERLCEFETYTNDMPKTVADAALMLRRWEKTTRLCGRGDNYRLLETDSWTPPVVTVPSLPLTPAEVMVSSGLSASSASSETSEGKAKESKPATYADVLDVYSVQKLHLYGKS